MTDARIRKISLRRAVIGLTIGVALLAFLGIVAWPGLRVYTLFKEGAITREQDHLASLGERMESEIERHVSVLEAESDTIGNILGEYREWDSLRSLLNTSLGQENVALLERQRRDRLLQELITGVGKREPLIGDLRLIGPDGNVIAAFNRQPPNPGDGEPPGSASPGTVIPGDAFDEGGAYIGPVSTQDGIPHMAIAISVDRGAEAVGTLVADIDVHALWSQTAALSLERGVTYYFVDENGALLAGTEVPQPLQTGLPVQVDLVRALQGGHEWDPYLPYPGISGMPVFGSAYPVRPLNGWAVSEIRTAAVSGPILSTMSGIAAGLLITLSLSGLFALLGVRLIIRPVAQLSQDLVRASLGDYGESRQTSSVAEVHTLIEGFNLMVAEVREREAKLLEAQRIGHLGHWNWNVTTGDLAWSDEIYRIFGLTPQSFGATYEAFLASVHPDDREMVIEAVNAAVDPERRVSYSIDHRIILPDDSVRTVHEQGEVSFDPVTGQAVRMLGTVSDITERKKMEQECQQYADTLQAIMDNAPFGIWLTDVDGRPQFVNETLCTVLGLRLSDLLASEHVGDLFDEQVRNEFSGGLGRGARNDQQRSIYTTLDIAEKGLCDFKVTRVNIRGDEGEITGFIGIVEDVTETRKMQERISHQATHDALTGLLNRSTLEQKLDQICQTIGPHDAPHALCYMDLDQFKVVNDTCGHHAGDELLRQLTVLYRKQVRKTETISGPDGVHLEPALARLGGDEFALLLYNCQPEDAQMVVQRLIDTTRSFCFSYEGQQFTVGCSVGIVPIRHPNDGMVEVMKQADSACYVAKEQGRGRCHLFQEGDEEVLSRQGAAQWVPRITEAIANDRLVVYAQPIVPLSTHENGDRFEVLVRYQADDGEAILPGAFLPAAERFFMMSQVDRWVIDHTFTELEQLYVEGKEKTLASASINLSGQTLGEEWLLEYICQKFAEGSIRPDQICFEITETAAIANLGTAQNLIAKLRDIGCRFALDDFGSGLSSFSYLHELKVDYLKIDGSLIGNIVTDPVGREMVTAIHKVGRAMDLRTVGEMVEDDATLEVLRDIGIDFAQGYGLGMPAPLSGDKVTR